MVKNCVYEILALPFYIDTIYKDTRTNTPLGIVHVETIFQCSFLIQYHINHKKINYVCLLEINAMLSANCMQNSNNLL